MRAWRVLWRGVWTAPAVAFVLLASGPTAFAEDAKLGVNLSRFVPRDVLAAVEAADPKAAKGACTSDIDLVSRLNTFKPYDRIEGLTSSGYNGDSVASYVNLDRFAAVVSGLVTQAHVDGNAALKTALIKKLSEWANAGAYLKTRDCSRGNCPPQWQTKRGTDLSPEKDAELTVNHIMGLALAYYPFLSSHDREELAADHAAIDRWMRTFSGRLMFGWADSAQRRSPRGIYDLQPIRSNLLFDLVKGDTKAFERRLNTSINGLAAQLNADGSIKDATVRGNRGLWYHFWTLDDVFWYLETLRANGRDIYPTVEERLQRAVTIFLDGIEDPATIYKWAKADVRSGGDPRTQQFDFAQLQFNDNGQSWLYVYLFRYPATENAKRLRSLLTRAPMGHYKDLKLGANIGCLYRVANPFMLDFGGRPIADLPPVTTFEFDFSKSPLSKRFDGASCSFAIFRSRDWRIDAQQIADGQLKVVASKLVVIRGEWTTGGPATPQTFKDTNLAVTEAGAVIGRMPIYAEDTLLGEGPNNGAIVDLAEAYGTLKGKDLPDGQVVFPIGKGMQAKLSLYRCTRQK